MSLSVFAPGCQRAIYSPRRLRSLVPVVSQHLSQLHEELRFNAFACRGLSSIPLASILAYEWGCHSSRSGGR